jgi:hypothetical protein
MKNIKQLIIIFLLNFKFACYSRLEKVDDKESNKSNSENQATITRNNTTGLPSQPLNSYGVSAWSSDPQGNNLNSVFSLVFQPPNRGFEQIYQKIYSQTDLKLLVNAINDSRIKFPKPITISFENCPGSPNAYWDATSSKVVMCYEIIEFLYQKRIQNTAWLYECVDDSVLHSIEFIMLHEIGHAVVSELKIPVTGSNEDVADQFAAISSLHTDRPDIVFGGGQILLQI